MSKIILRSSQLKKLMETAMDLDIYVQPIDHPTSSGNEPIISSIESTIGHLKELLSSFKTGKKLYPTTETKIHKILDIIKSIYSEVNTEN